MKNLAINGGSKIFAEKPSTPTWPPVYPETAEKLKEIYFSQKWGFYGPCEAEFNIKFAEYNNVKHSIMMANGTVTLELALRALGVKAGDEVIVPAHTWLATGQAPAYLDATPVVVDIEEDTLCMDPAAFEAAITPRTTAVIPVHLYGSMANMDEIMRIARKHNLAVIEDCAHTHGSVWGDQHAGTIGDVGSFSFQQSKIMASGEGGACTTKSDELMDKLSRLSHIGYPFGARQGQKVPPPEAGSLCHNYRVTEFQAAILLSQLAHLKEDTELRAKNAAYLRKRIDAIPGLKVQAAGKRTTLQAYYTFTVLLDDKQLKPGLTNFDFMKAMQAEGVSVHEMWGQPMYKQNLWTVAPDRFRIESCETAERMIYHQTLHMALQYLMLPEKETVMVADAFEKVMKAFHA